MKKSLITMVLAITILVSIITHVFAANNLISLEGELTVEPGENSTLIVKVASNDTIGVVSGKIGYNSNIINVEVTGRNNWGIQYNKETGVFNAYKAQGANAEEIIEIKYTALNSEGTGEITLSDIKVTNINYEEESISNVTKTIAIKESTPSNTVNNTTNQTGNNATNDTENQVKNENTMSNKGNETSDSKNNTTTDIDKNTSNGTINKTNINTTNTESKKTELPRTGAVKTILPIFIVLVGIISIGAYLGYRKYKGIK